VIRHSPALRAKQSAEIVRDLLLSVFGKVRLHEEEFLSHRNEVKNSHEETRVIYTESIPEDENERTIIIGHKTSLY